MFGFWFLIPDARVLPNLENLRDRRHQKRKFMPERSGRCNYRARKVLVYLVLVFPSFGGGDTGIWRLMGLDLEAKMENDRRL